MKLRQGFRDTWDAVINKDMVLIIYPLHEFFRFPVESQNKIQYYALYASQGLVIFDL
jgi:hypothetical protein